LAPARAGCGEIERVKATKNVNPSGPEPLAVGDSVMLLALHNLARTGYDTNGQGCRSFADGLQVIRSERAKGELPRLVVLALGTDGMVGIGNVETALGILGPERVLGLVTPRELGGNAGFDASVVRRAAALHPTRIVLLDWVRFSTGHHSWFQPDHTHLSYAGAAAFARLLGKALRFSGPNHFPNRTRFPSGAAPHRGHHRPSRPAGGTVLCRGRRPTIRGTSGPDKIDGTARRDVIVGLGGGDQIRGKGGNDVICAGRGTDFVFGGTGGDMIDGGNNADTLFGGTGNDNLRGQRGVDYVEGEKGSDRLAGGPDGGTPVTADIASFAGKSHGVTVNLARRTATGQGRDTLIGIEGVMGSYLPDTIVGDNNANSLAGAGSGDTIRGAGGNDAIGGGPGDDKVLGGTGNDRVLGGTGFDALHGNSGRDILIGYSYDDGLYGGAGNDTLRGNEGSDRIYGEDGDDYLDGGSGQESGTGDHGNGGPQAVGDTCRRLETSINCEL
jgi:hypothetical protein